VTAKNNINQSKTYEVHKIFWLPTEVTTVRRTVALRT